MRILFFLIVASVVGACSSQNEIAQKKKKVYTNELIHEDSPYLLQHAHNPVNWYPWGDKALNKAKKENKLLIISIGYSSCHWCHVMEEESFEDTTVANMMNNNFVSIKVDREQRPDIDQQYMEACVMMTGSGGWPLNIIALPDGRPFYAGTYFEKEQWMEVLAHFVDLQRSDPEKLKDVANDIADGIGQMEVVPFKEKASFPYSETNASVDKFAPQILDFDKGGLKGSPKFPLPSVWEFMMHQNGEGATSVVTMRTLESIYRGGLYDHLGGGFARYSTDENWKVPHFEKMLYDNGQLVSAYSHLYQKQSVDSYKRVITETLDFIEREMTSKEGAFYSSLDADSDGEEGAFYVWSKDEIDKVLGADSKFFCETFNVTKRGNWDGKNILHLDKPAKDPNALVFGELDKNALNRIQRCKDKLWKARSKRTRPNRDDKILTAWNALMLQGYIDAYRAIGDENYRKAALKNAHFISDKMMAKDGSLKRNYMHGKASIDGFLDDYAFTISAFIELYQITFDTKWLDEAKLMMSYTDAHFSDPSKRFYYYTSDQQKKLMNRGMVLDDRVMPSSNAVMAENLFYLGKIFYDKAYTKRSRYMLSSMDDKILENPFSYGRWMQLRILFSFSPLEVAIVGDNADAIRKELSKKYLPNVIFIGGKSEGNLDLLKGKLQAGKTMIYVCQDQVCQKPTSDVEEALEQLHY